jgi:hypothetical protein
MGRVEAGGGSMVELEMNSGDLPDGSTVVLTVIVQKYSYDNEYEEESRVRVAR